MVSFNFSNLNLIYFALNIEQKNLFIHLILITDTLLSFLIWHYLSKLTCIPLWFYVYYEKFYSQTKVSHMAAHKLSFRNTTLWSLKTELYIFYKIYLSHFINMILKWQIFIQDFKSLCIVYIILTFKSLPFFYIWKDGKCNLYIFRLCEISFYPINFNMLPHQINWAHIYAIRYIL